MAWRGSAGATSPSAATTLAVTFPVTANAGDIIVLHVSSGGSSVLTFTCSGYSAVPGLSNVGYIGASGTLGALYKVAVGGETAATVTKSSTADFMALQCNIFSGRNTTTPFTGASTSAAQFGSSPQSIACGTITAAAGDDLLFLTGEGNNVSNTSPTLTVPSGFANKLDTFSAVANVPAANSCNQVNVSAGATGTITGSIAFTGGANNDAGGYMLSIAAGSVGPPPIAPYGPMPKQIYIMP
jgi:hypothetical protein